MNTVLIVLACLSGRFCSEEPVYAVVYMTEQMCITAAAEVKNSTPGKSRKVKAICVPEVKVPKL